MTLVNPKSYVQAKVTGAYGKLLSSIGYNDVGGKLQTNAGYYLANQPRQTISGAQVLGTNTQDASALPYTITPIGYNPAGPAIPDNFGKNNNNNNNNNVVQNTSNPGVKQNYDQGIQNIQSQGNQGMDQIEQDYQNALGQLAGQEQGLRGQADVATGQISSNVASTQNELQNAQSGAQADIQSKVKTAETGGQTAMQQARDLFRQTQQQNIAQLSALGISSSSVQEALAERLGVETARRIAGVTGSIQEVRQNAQQELQRTNQYYQGKMNDLKSWADNQKASIQQSLIQGLNQINSARDQAASDKARGRSQLLSNVQNAIYGLTQQYQQYQQSLDTWAQQKASALTPIVTDPNFLQTLSNTTNTLNQSYAPTGFQYAPQFSTDPYGQVKGQISYGLQKKPNEQDLTAPAF